ncbi:T9SS type A sorting domain-containing protein [Aequorivita echinoideorum]|uniref:T9SS type A sorting domain-containing protein n=1 Tax=Aequorivita echinoideorum TaxID=1549647 RepID=A0ABS5S3R3_9FLAO|nr:T9SS type A sorting domain-containing protein [Aequorivita echinoideorum]MBT0607032.1 T9SS type A sorting domain-containing protein [Aequorivita echinoideorum]
MKTLLLFLAGIFSIVTFSQDGGLDTSFGDGEIVITDLNNSQDLVFNVAEQADQKIIVSGVTMQSNQNYYPYLVRFMPDGTLDTAFGLNGLVLKNDVGFYDFSYLFIDDSQRIIAAGPKNQSSTFVIAKYLDSGNLDTTFADNGIKTIPDGNYVAMNLMDDGSFLLLKFSANNTITLNHYLSNGVLDLNFGNNGAAISTFSGDSFQGVEIKTDADNNIYFLGKRDNNANSDIILMKFNADGYLDNNFGTNGMAIKNIDALNPMNFSTASLDFTNDNKILIAGSCGACIDLFEPVMQPYFIRYQNDGQPDSSFGNNGTVLLPISSFSITQVIIQENQRILVAGKLLDCFEGSIYKIERYFPGGTSDYSFLGASLEFDNYKTILQEEGNIVSAGNTYWYNGVEDVILVRHNNNPLSLPEFENQDISIFPNPSTGIFTVEKINFAEKQTYQIIDITGKIIESGEFSDLQSKIDLSNAQSGLYFMTTSIGTFRLIKN